MTTRLLRTGLASLSLALAAVPGRAAVSTPPLKVSPFESPASLAKGASAPVLTTAPDGLVWLAWAAPADEGGMALRCAALDSGHHWTEAKLICQSQNIALGDGAGPALAAGADNDLAIIWPERNHAAKFSLSPNRGLTWTAPVSLTKESLDVTAPAVCILVNGDPLAVWLDGRTVDKAHPPLRVKLYTRFLSGPLSAFSDWMLASDAVAGCPPQIHPMLDGGALVGYRALDTDGHLIAKTIRLHNRRWKMGDPVSPDTWTSQQPVNEAPRFAVDGGRVGVIWFSGATDRHPAQICASASPDAGARFLLAAPLASGAQLHTPEIALLHDGALLTAWLSGPTAEAQLHLCRLSPELYSDDETHLGADTPRASGQPQLALVQDYSGDANSAQLLLAYPSGGGSPAIRTYLITVPEGDLLAAAASDCHCSPSPTQLLGYPVRGIVKAIDPEHLSMSVDLDAAPGIMDAGVHEFKSSAAVLMSVRSGSDIMARIDRQDKGWRIFEVHALGQ